MIDVFYIADHEWINPPSRCDGCGKPVQYDDNAVMLTIKHDSQSRDIVLCRECRRELFEKI